MWRKAVALLLALLLPAALTASPAWATVQQDQDSQQGSSELAEESGSSGEGSSLGSAHDIEGSLTSSSATQPSSDDAQSLSSNNELEDADESSTGEGVDSPEGNADSGQNQASDSAGGSDEPSLNDGEYFHDGIESAEEMEAIVAQAQDAAASASVDVQSAEPMMKSRAAAKAAPTVQSFSGDTRFDTAAMIARASFSKADCAIIAADGGWPDALAGASLAGLMDCPILLTSKSGLSSATRSVINDLGIKHTIVLGGSLVISNKVISDLKGISGMKVERLAGETRQDTQMLIYDYGKNKVSGATWSSTTVAITSGYRFPDALSFSPLAYRDHVPVFLVDSSGNLNAKQKQVLNAAKYREPVVLGGNLVVSSSTLSFANNLAKSAGNAEGATHLAGETQYDTSSDIASWLVKSKGFSWNNVAFATGNLPYDALTGSVLQGKRGSVIVVTDHAYDAGVSAAKANKGSISSLTFFGGELAISTSLRNSIVSALSGSSSSTSGQVTTKSYGISYNRMLQLEQASIKNLAGMSSADKQSNLAKLPDALNPNTYAFGDDEFYQFAVLTNGYSGVSASALNGFINTYGSSGKLAGQGAAFVQAAQTYGVNEMYLLAHAILESGWGKSSLAMGYYYDGKTKVNGKYYPAGTYYNFFGIGAYDTSPLSGGRALAIKEGWNTPAKAIVGAAKWIKSNYLANGYGPQNTLYLMKWDIYNAIQSGTPWCQYATGVQWATSIASVMANGYEYCGKSQAQSGLKFQVPVYAG